ncbi:hypothetical protein [Actinomadura litoris]|uniref:hypothetical protein n=1 Tax=Actinomadura litoris TaxID=2678616 RepID=UPI001FA71CE2|nr:hypothetical protein [Actinomadura litoris]
MARPKTGETPGRNVKIGDEWDDLGDAIGARNRAKAIRTGIAWYLSVHPVWSHYAAVCAEEGIDPAEDLHRYVETRVRDWHRKHADKTEPGDASNG